MISYIHDLIDHTLILFKNLCTLLLFDLIKLRTAIFMYKVYYNLLPLNFWNIFYTHHCTNQQDKAQKNM